ncbi:hypothetical protein ACTFIU_004778 [Dictyostelium citrinum]
MPKGYEYHLIADKKGHHGTVVLQRRNQSRSPLVLIQFFSSISTKAFVKEHNILHSTSIINPLSQSMSISITSLDILSQQPSSPSSHQQQSSSFSLHPINHQTFKDLKQLSLIEINLQSQLNSGTSTNTPRVKILGYLYIGSGSSSKISGNSISSDSSISNSISSNQQHRQANSNNNSSKNTVTLQQQHSKTRTPVKTQQLKGLLFPISTIWYESNSSGHTYYLAEQNDPNVGDNQPLPNSSTSWYESKF